MALRFLPMFGALIAVVLLPSICRAVNLDDAFVTCSTRGTDRYADGTAVADGESYALVYTKPGCVFAGFNADGSVANPAESELVAVAPLAKGGRCPRTLFSLRREYVNSRQQGSWEIYLLDTRDAAGKPTKLDDRGVLGRVRRFGKAEADLAGVRAGEGSAADQGATRLAAVPKDAPQPRITGIKVEDGVVKISVDRTVPYLVYGLRGGKSMEDFNANPRSLAKRNRDGDADREIVIEATADAAAGCGLFKVVQEQ